MTKHRFFATKLGQASVASTMAMLAFVAFGSQMTAAPVTAMQLDAGSAERA